MRSVFITGGTTGIGLELASTYASKGWRVGVCGRELNKFEENLSKRFQNISFYQVDVSDREGMKSALFNFSQVDGLDLVIANAGISHTSKTKIPDFEWSYRMVHVNLLGVMYTFEAALDIMIPRGKGHLVAVSSIAGYNGLPGVSAYSATKAAVIKYCESLHLDLRQFNINVTTICPGFVETPLTARNPHSMPFIVKASKAAELIIKAIEQKKMFYAFPFVLASIVRILSMLPRTWYRAFMDIKYFNYSKD